MASAAPPIKRSRTLNCVPAVMRVSLEKAEVLLAARKTKAVVEQNGQEDPALWCLVDTGMLQNGYPSVSYSHTAANIQVSHLALRVEKGEEHVPHRSRRETASHLCHNKRCIKAEHIIKESVGSNGRRNGCLAFISCECGTRLNACGHSPRCILPFPQQAAEEEQEGDE